MRSTQRDGAGVSVLSRATAVLAAFDERSPVLGVAEIARRSGLAKSTVHRLCGELCAVRLLERHPAGYRLGTWLFELGELVPTHRTLSQAAQPILEDLREATHQRVHLAVLDGVDVVYVAILGGSSLGLASRVGGRLPAHSTGVGKAILAYSTKAVLQARIAAGLPQLTPRTIGTPEELVREMRRIRSIGMALDVEESHPDVSCVAAPVFGADRKVVAGLSITGQTTSLDPRTMGPAVRTAAFVLSRTLRTSGI